MAKKQPTFAQENSSYQIGEIVSWRGFILKVLALNADGSAELINQTTRVQISDLTEVHKEPALNGN